MSDNGPEEFGAEAGSEDAGADAAEKAREILDRIKGEREEMASEVDAMMESSASDTGADSLVSDDGDVAEDDGMLETAGAAITGAIGGAAAAAEGLFDRAKDALDDIIDDNTETLPAESGVEHVVGTSGGDDSAETSWIGWMLGAAGIVLLLALLVSQCADASTRSSVESAGVMGQLGVLTFMSKNLLRA
ncbi:MAG: hypothetical protein KJO36_02300 [Acidimicrobiia bacterium]|nr:hypothetical protein [Acidimicrobiia bacterium]